MRYAPLIALLLCGCVERRFVVVTDPPGAAVFVNDVPVGPSPADVPFTYYGKYRITAVADGYEPLAVAQDVPAPFYQYVPLDFAAENLWPFHIEDVRRFEYRLQPQCQVNGQALIQQGQTLRDRGKAIPGDPQAYRP